VYRVTPRISLYASYGRGFESPTLDELAYKLDNSPGLNTALQAARSNNYELGAKTRLGNGLTAGAALFSTRTTNEIVVQSNSNGRSTFYNAGQTRRDGVEASIEAHPFRAWTFAASGSLIDAHFDDSFLTCPSPPCATPAQKKLVRSGNKLPSVPARTAWAQVKYDAGVAAVSVEARAQSALFVNDLNSDYAGGAAVFNATIERTFRWSTLRPHLFARVDNLANRRYVGSVIVNESNSRFFEPAPTRTWLLGVDLPF